MRVPDRDLDELRQRGFLRVEGFLHAAELAAAQEALWRHFPRPAAYFADPTAHAWLAGDQWAGLVRAPWASWDLNRLAFHPDLLDLAERFLDTVDLRLYEAELWGKYAGAVDYGQRHHRDFVNHSLVVPQRSAPPAQLLAWILLSDVGEGDGPTMVVPLDAGGADAVAYWPVPGHHDITEVLDAGAFADEEVAMTGPAGTLVAFRSDVLHRASAMTGARASRFALLADYDAWGPRWTGRVGWPERATGPDWFPLIERATPRERLVFGFPAPGDPYWDDQTLADTQRRYPGADLTPYRAGPWSSRRG